jgi:hypothetical protein
MSQSVGTDREKFAYPIESLPYTLEFEDPKVGLYTRGQRQKKAP